MKKKTGEVVVLVLAALMALGLVAGVLFLAWHLLEGLDHATLTWWAFIATGLLVPVALGSFWLGRVVAKAQVEGLKLGVDTVIEAARRTAEVRISTARQARRTAPPAGGVNVFFPVPGLPGGTVPGTTTMHFIEPDTDEVVEL